MSTIFLASKTVGALRTNIPALRKTNVYAPKLRWVGLAVGAVVVALGIMSFFLPVGNPLIWGGIYGCIAGVVVLIMQSGLTFVNRLLGFLLEVFYWRALCYIALSIGCYFALPVLVVGGVLLDLLAVAYIAVAYFFKEREYYDAATIAREEERARQKQRLDAETRGPVHV